MERPNIWVYRGRKDVELRLELPKSFIPIIRDVIRSEKVGKFSKVFGRKVPSWILNEVESGNRIFGYYYVSGDLDGDGSITLSKRINEVNILLTTIDQIYKDLYCQLLNKLGYQTCVVTKDRQGKSTQYEIYVIGGNKVKIEFLKNLSLRHPLKLYRKNLLLNYFDRRLSKRELIYLWQNAEDEVLRFLKSIYNEEVLQILIEG